jgi:mRNA interferase MazF
MILLEQLRTIDKCRVGEYVGHLGEREMERLRGPLGNSVGLGLLEQEPPELLLCLCPSCAKQYCNVPGYIVRRVDSLQQKTGVCTYCGDRKGYDYWIVVNNQK